MKKLILLIASIILVAAFAVCGTYAVLTSHPEQPVRNTFAFDGLSMTLWETNAGESLEKAIPGVTIEKDPTITIEADGADCYLFAYVDMGIIVNGNAIVASCDIDSAAWTAVARNADGSKVLYSYGNGAVIEGQPTDADYNIFENVTLDYIDYNMDTSDDVDGSEITVSAYATQAGGVSYDDAELVAINHYNGILGAGTLTAI